MKLDGKFICLINWDDWNIGESKRDTEDSNCHSNSNIWLPRIWRITAFFEDRSLFDPGPLIGYCIVATRRTFQLFQSHKLTPIFSRRIYFFHPICAYYFHPATWSRQFLSKQFCQKKACTLRACSVILQARCARLLPAKACPFCRGALNFVVFTLFIPSHRRRKTHFCFKVINMGYLRLNTFHATSYCPTPRTNKKLQNIWW